MAWKAYEDLTVGDLAGLSPEMMERIMEEAPRKRTKTDREIFEEAQRAAEEIFRF